MYKHIKLCAYISPSIKHKSQNNLMMDLSINTNSSSSSPKGWRYVLLTSPKSKLKLSPLNLPFLMIFLGVGFLLGGTMWNNTISEQRHIETNKDMTVSGSIREQQKDHHVTPVDGRKGSLPLCWLMSFPVSNVLCDLYGRCVSNQQPSELWYFIYQSPGENERKATIC